MVTNVHVADAFGALRAEIAALTKRSDVMRAEIIALGESPIEGDLFRVTVSETVRETPADEREHPLVADFIAALKADKRISPQWLAGNAKRSPVVTVRAVARTGR